MDTSVKQVAIDAGMYVEARTIPISLTASLVGSSAVIQGMSDAVLGMKVGETKNGTISPGKGLRRLQQLVDPAVFDQRR